MAPKLSANEGIVLSYINEQNRPLNAQNVADALQKQGIKKASAEKILNALGDNHHVTFKEYGKQKIYLAKQDQFEIPSAEELERMKKENERLQSEVKSVKSAIGEFEAELRSVQSLLTDTQIKDETKRLNDEIPDLEAKLNKLKTGATLITTDEKEKIVKNYTFKTSLWRKRKRIFKDLWDMITESIPNDLAKMKEELGVETDEDVGIKVDDYCNLAVSSSRPAVKKLKR